MGKGTESCHWPNALALAGWLLNNRKMFVWLSLMFTVLISNNNQPLIIILNNGQRRRLRRNHSFAYLLLKIPYFLLTCLYLEEDV